MGRMPRVTIITPTFNHAGYIGEAIDSVLAQTFGDWEMLVVDDGSTDGTGDVVARYDDPRIRLFRKANGGIMRLHEGYNLALGEARGDLIAILEGDDYWPPDKLAFQVPEFDDPAVVLVSGYAHVVDDEHHDRGTVPPHLMPEDVRLNRPVGAATRAMILPFSLNFTFPVATMMRRSALERIGGFQQPSDLPLVDYPTMLAMSLEGEFRFVERNCGYWRRHPASTTTSRFPDILNGCYRESMRVAQDEGGRIGLTAAEIDAAEMHWEQFQSLRCSYMGRMLAKKRRYKDASRAFRLGNTFRRSRTNRQMATLAARFTDLHLPVEWLFWLAHPTFSGNLLEGASTLGGDPLVRVTDVDLPWPMYRRGSSAPTE